MKPLLLDIPDFIETERLLLRTPRAGDGPAIHEAVMESMAELQVWMPWAKPDRQLDESEAFARRSVAHWIERTNLDMLLVEKETGLVVGCGGFPRMDWEVPSFEIGYWLRTSHWGRGLMTEAVVAWTDFAFDILGARRVEIRCDARNERSGAVARRAGFTFEATLVNNARENGRLRSTHIFALTREDDYEA
jgi:RimJ/RimL family protein N-acetyltransferase